MAYDYVQWATILIAIYGAALSTALLITMLLENRRMLKVVLSTSDIIVHRPGQTEIVMKLSCSNIGKRPITLNSYGVELPNKKILMFFNQAPDRLPKTLKDGEQCVLWKNLKNVSKTMNKEGFSNTIKLRGLFGDVTGKKYFSKKIEFNPAEWIKD